MKLLYLSFICILLSLTSCAFFDKAKLDPYSNMTEVELYNQGSAFLAVADIPQAVVVFQMLEARYPFSTYAQQSILDLAYAYYDFGQKDDTIAECDRFIDLYPNHQSLDYAYYLRALSNLEKEQPFFQEFLGQDVSKYDVTRLKKAYSDFLLISNRFKGSKYANDAENRLVFLRNSMANHEVYIATYYLNRGAFIASSERAKYMLETYPGAPASKRALIILIESYNKLGSINLAIETAKVLSTNYSNYSYTIDKNNLVVIKDNSIDDNVVEKSSFFDFGLF
jgi:outer membrane protein assembly factor BamD